jgi:hypothetical protein
MPVRPIPPTRGGRHLPMRDRHAQTRRRWTRACHRRTPDRHPPTRHRHRRTPDRHRWTPDVRRSTRGVRRAMPAHVRSMRGVRRAMPAHVRSTRVHSRRVRTPDRRHRLRTSSRRARATAGSSGPAGFVQARHANRAAHRAPRSPRARLPRRMTAMRLQRASWSVNAAASDRAAPGRATRPLRASCAAARMPGAPAAARSSWLRSTPRPGSSSRAVSPGAAATLDVFSVAAVVSFLLARQSDHGAWSGAAVAGTSCASGRRAS